MADQALQTGAALKPLIDPGIPSAGSITLSAATETDTAALPQHAIDAMTVLSAASGAIQTSLSAAQLSIVVTSLFFVLLSIGLTVLSYFGYKYMVKKAVKSAMKAAQTDAEKHLQDYLNSQEFLTRLNEAVQNAANDAIQKLIQFQIASNPPRGKTDESTFSPPQAPQPLNGGPS